MAADLVHRRVAVLVSTGGLVTIRAAIAATRVIPIVFTVGADPVKMGLVASLSRPGGNVTGVNLFTTEMDAKRLGLLRDMVPALTSIAALINPTNAPAEVQAKNIEEAARGVGLQVYFVVRKHTG